MSQSDYIKFKKISIELTNSSDFPPIFNMSDYINYEEYALENTIRNTKITYNVLTPSNKLPVYGMLKSTTNTCAQNYKLCKNTNQRPNRRPLLGPQQTPTPPRPLTEEQLSKTIQQSDLCVCTNH